LELGLVDNFTVGLLVKKLPSQFTSNNIFMQTVAWETRRRWVDNIKMDLVEVGWGGEKWIGLA
jgi:hypothetical protein